MLVGYQMLGGSPFGGVPQRSPPNRSHAAVDDIHAALDRLATHNSTASRPSTSPQQQQQPTVNFVQRLGSGAFGEVWHAEWKGQQVAAKITGCPTGFRREEVAALRAAQGHHTVKLLAEEERTSKGGAIIMELCNGSLDQQLAQAKAAEQSCSPQEFLERLGEIATGLAALHQQQLIFNDLKPDNLLFGASGQLLFSDFGDARDMRVSVAGKSVHDMGWGSPNYHARPDVMAMVLTTASDLWMLAQTMIHIWTRTPASCNPSAVPEQMPLKQQLVRCLSPNPDERPTASEMVYHAHHELQVLFGTRKDVNEEAVGSAVGSAVSDTQVLVDERERLENEIAAVKQRLINEEVVIQ